MESLFPAGASFDPTAPFNQAYDDREACEICNCVARGRCEDCFRYVCKRHSRIAFSGAIRIVVCRECADKPQPGADETNELLGEESEEELRNIEFAEKCLEEMGARQ